MTTRITDVVEEELEETHGWLADSGLLGSARVRRLAKWSILSQDGSSVLTVERDGDRPGYRVPFGPHVPAHLIVAACAEAAADCHRCGTRCEGDCAIPDVTVDGEAI